jgi:hypothetical protein
MEWKEQAWQALTPTVTTDIVGLRDGGCVVDNKNTLYKLHKGEYVLSKHMVDKFKDAGVYLPRRRGKKLGSIQMPSD